MKSLKNLKLGGKIHLSNFCRRKQEKKLGIYYTYSGAGSPSASHSIIKGLSFSSGLDLTWNSNSSVGGCFTIFGGLWTEKEITNWNGL